MTQRREMRDGVREAGRNVRGLGVFRLVKRCVCTFFFFFFEFRPDSAVSVDTGRYGPSRPDFGRVGADFRRIGADFSRVGLRRPDSGLATWHNAVRRGTDARSAASLPRPRVGRGCAGLGAAFVNPSGGEVDY